MRIQVLFNETSVLVPCGDGRLTVKELVDKAIVRFKKVLNKVGVHKLICLATNVMSTKGFWF